MTVNQGLKKFLISWRNCVGGVYREPIHNCFWNSKKKSYLLYVKACNLVQIWPDLVRKVNNLYLVKPIYEIDMDYWGQIWNTQLVILWITWFLWIPIFLKLKMMQLWYIYHCMFWKNSTSILISVKLWWVYYVLDGSRCYTWAGSASVMKFLVYSTIYSLICTLLKN